MNKIKLAWFYPQELNLYGDTGNVEILKMRSLLRGIEFEEVVVNKDTDTSSLEDINIVFMGGGPDSKQVGVYEDLVNNKKRFLVDYYNNNGVGLFVCGAYQLIGKYYELSSGEKIKGLGILDFYTKSPSVRDKRLVGNIETQINKELFSGLIEKYGQVHFKGFENHGGRTFLGNNLASLGVVLKGNGNNDTDKTEGVIDKNFICTYMHGPVLHMNYFLADYLIARALNKGVADLSNLDNELEKRVNINNVFKN